MKNIFCLVLTIILLNACKVVNIDNDTVDGAYKAKGKDYLYSLILQKDSTFTIEYKGFEITSNCEGKWQMKGTDLIILKCNEPQNVAETLQSGYMSTRVIEVKVKSKRELIYNNVILKKDKL
ncbi:hypothetical protein EV143_1252 [Flavobacterium chryseum]|uniref:hypothetical protein n=1 Tax=Flavobacterium sp. P3160 TaxID=2512113 RepID=UPI00105DC32B|nr:hypothetical protein [Flavobacterium sp. P3160]TDO67869.1 hypothetical protein EV143_1252 [Flavobacterium sp. P3160]